MTKNEARGNAAADTMQIAGGKTVATKPKLENTQNWITGRSTGKTGSWGSKPNTKAWQKGELVPTTNGNVELMAKKSASVVRETAGAGTEWKTVGKPASKHVTATQRRHSHLPNPSQEVGKVL